MRGIREKSLRKRLLGRSRLESPPAEIAAHQNGEPPLRAELFNIEQLREHARHLAGWHEVIKPGADRLLPRLAENERALLEAYGLISDAVHQKREIAPADEWLLDNFYLIEEQIRLARLHFPRSYSRELPRISDVHDGGYPRVYELVLELIAHVDGRVDAESLSTFIDAYQGVTTLNLGELWAIPIMLRLALIENLRRVATRLAADRRSRDLAGEWAERLLGAAQKDLRYLLTVLADLVRGNPAMTPAFVAEISRRLQGQGLGASFPMYWLEQCLTEQEQSLEHLLQQESQSQAADQVSIGNSIGSLRFLAAMDWREFVETLSVVEQILRDDPAGTYGGMDFATRDTYRHRVEMIARHCPRSEQEVARQAVALARERLGDANAVPRFSHVGYFLIDAGRQRLERAVNMRLPLRLRVGRAARRGALWLYVGGTIALTLGMTVWLLAEATQRGAATWHLWLLALPALIATSHAALAVINWMATACASPQVLPKMDFSTGIPPDCRTICVIPTMLSSAGAVADLLDALEVRFLANRDPHLFFALLTDDKDAPQEVMPEDEELLHLAREGIAALNRKYADDERDDPFFLLHRPRRWNPQQNSWMGWERKRGKLADFNAYLRGGAEESFSLAFGTTEILPEIKYVITLDSDTQLPRDAARQFVGTIAHPLNRAVFDARLGRVIAGYTILQPRVAISLPSASRSLYARLFAGEAGIDPYTRAVSDVYQDLFGEGSFIGKGIYDVDAFEQALKGRFPENRILSHDLLEGAHARSGLISDLLLYEDHPASYTTDTSRRHRWIRGDWQIASWLLPQTPGADGARTRNVVSGLSRWKILDNLRRSLAPAALVTLLVLGWFLPGPATFYTVAVVLVLFVPALLGIVEELLRKGRDVPLGTHLRWVGASAGRSLSQAGFALITLPYEAHSALDAIIRTAARLAVSRKRLLEWQTAREAELNSSTSLSAFFQAMWIAPVMAGGLAVLLDAAQRAALPAAAPLLALWLLAPLAAWWLSCPRRRRERSLPADDVEFLRGVARRTWRYFETFVGPADNHLPPDNYQEHPAEVVAHRTSPTNIGISLLADLGAYDFGYVSTGQLLERIGKTLSTMEGLERYRGHLYNWYDTRTLAPLPPLYVSSVDSGNLIGHLLVVRSGLMDLGAQPIVPPQLWSGLRDTLMVLQEVGGELPRRRRRARDDRPADKLRSLTLRLLADLQGSPQTLTAGYALLRQLVQAATDLTTLAADSPDETKWWAGAFQRQCLDGLDELTYLAPWVVAASADSADIASAAPAALALEQSEVPARIPTLSELAALAEQTSHSAFREAGGRARRRMLELEKLARRCAALADVDMEFLYDRARHLLSIGYNASTHRLDTSFYDLLASEARFGSYVAIAQGKLPQDNWFAMSRALTVAEGDTALLSWSGSMFEYLMPLLLMPAYENTLLAETYHAVVRRQIKYGKQHSTPWGISESGYNLTDTHLNYQYRAFGVPGLGLKRGLSNDLVIAPYASAMALMVAPEQACANLHRLADDGRLGRHGFYEAIDYTPARLAGGQSSATVRSFMAHHQGMSFLALAHALLDRPMQRRFMSEPLFRATEQLLHERVPKAAPLYPHAAETTEPRPAVIEVEGGLRVLRKPATTAPEVHLLSNGRYHVMITESGGGYSRHKDLAVTRWREDPTRDCWGLFAYVRDVDADLFWSVTHQPLGKPAQDYEAMFSAGRAEFRRRDDEILTRMEIAVSPEDDIEVRRISISNQSRRRRTLELTSYGEVVLAPPAAEAAHPVFSNLFVQTEILPERQALLCTRRPRAADERPPWMMHLLAVSATNADEATYETDRAAFIGRGRDLQDPAAMHVQRLGNSQGAVLDPIIAIRRRITLAPEETVTCDLVVGVAETRDAVLALVEKYHDRRLTERVFELAWTHSQVILRQLQASEAEAQNYSRLAGALIYANPTRRAAANLLVRNRRGQPGLWGYGISGDHPIALLLISDVTKVELVRQCVRAHTYWRSKGLSVDLVILNEDFSGYRQDLHDLIVGIIAGGSESGLLDRAGGIFIRRAEQFTEDDRGLLLAAARVVLTDSSGSLAEQAEPRRRAETLPPRFAPAPAPAAGRRSETPRVNEAGPALMYFNGRGGFTHDGREYIIRLAPGQVTPAPWSNVLANGDFGTVVTESGGGYTWAENAHEFRLTPWSNDPISDTCGEAYYLRDEETGRYWSPAPGPARGATPYVTRHGFGYTVFEHMENGIATQMTVYVATDAPVKFVALNIRNHSGRARKLSLTGYLEWVLGEQRSKTAPHVVTERDAASGALLARNSFNAEFPERIAFFDVSESARTFTASRTEFLGRTGSATRPAALERSRLSGRVGAGFDPCAALQVMIRLSAGEEREVVFRIGAGRTSDEALGHLRRTHGLGAAKAALEGVWNYWNRTLGAVHVETPDPSLNFLANGWLVYQVLACRMWARSGFYQSGGAFGFRDQLQDAMALVHSEPQLLRGHLLHCASRQFREGDVQHWWHPPLGRGVRTHISDDYLWLPYATCRYVHTTGDTGVLDEKAHFLEGRLPRPEEESYYDLPARTAESTDLYDHCVRAIRNGLKFGAHGLPLMGAGDWNDGMNLVGAEGAGESVWLGFFLHDVLMRFTSLAELRGDEAFAQTCREQAATLARNLAEHGWDGQWYRRAYFDNGEPLGASGSPECQIDALPQSWAALTGVGEAERTRAAMDAVDTRLVRRDARLIKLFDPAFDKSDLNPGYIKGYVPGVRENGGQYTHAAIWTVMACAALGDRARAWELFSLINPVTHGAAGKEIAKYQVEPYVVAADVYANPQHVGRGGWTWYTGSAGWMYRLITESLLGLRLEVNRLRFQPVLPPEWQEFKIHYRYRETFHHITVRNRGATTVTRVLFDGVEQTDGAVPLVDDRQEHHAEVELG